MGTTVAVSCGRRVTQCGTSCTKRRSTRPTAASVSSTSGTKPAPSSMRCIVPTRPGASDIW
eukprot:11182732-Lingulodinium_polyedra.AAC.1